MNFQPGRGHNVSKGSFYRHRYWCQIADRKDLAGNIEFWGVVAIGHGCDGTTGRDSRILLQWRLFHTGEIPLYEHKYNLKGALHYSKKGSLFAEWGLLYSERALVTNGGGGGGSRARVR